MRQWQKLIVVNIVFNFVVSVSSLILLIFRFGLMLPGVLWLTKEINNYTGDVITEIEVHYKIFLMLGAFLIFDIVIFSIQIGCSNVNALRSMTTDKVFQQYANVIRLLVILWGAEFFIFGATDWYLIQFY